MLTALNVVFNMSPVAINQSLIDPTESLALTGFKIFITYFALLSFLIPISLVVTLEIVRFVQASYIQWDTDMEH